MRQQSHRALYFGFRVTGVQPLMRVKINTQPQHRRKQKQLPPTGEPEA